MGTAPLKNMIVSTWLIKPLSGSPAPSYPLVDVAGPSP